VSATGNVLEVLSCPLLNREWVEVGRRPSAGTTSLSLLMSLSSKLSSSSSSLCSGSYPRSFAYHIIRVIDWQETKIQSYN